MSVQNRTVLDRVERPPNTDPACLNCGALWSLHGGQVFDFGDACPVGPYRFSMGFRYLGASAPAPVCTGCARGAEPSEQRLPPARPCSRCGELTRFIVGATK